MKRRQLLSSAATVGFTLIAGCSSSSSSDNQENQENSPNNDQDNSSGGLGDAFDSVGSTNSTEDTDDQTVSSLGTEFEVISNDFEGETEISFNRVTQEEDDSLFSDTEYTTAIGTIKNTSETPIAFVLQTDFYSHDDVWLGEDSVGMFDRNELRPKEELEFEEQMDRVDVTVGRVELQIEEVR